VILPTKHISTEDSLLGVGRIILNSLYDEASISHLWERVRSHPNVGSFERFILTLDLLYCLDAIFLEDGVLRKRRA
jgi:hypothetical protein